MLRCTVSHQEGSVVEGGTVVPPVAGSAPSAHKVITWLPWPHFVPPSQILNPFLPQPSVLTNCNTCTFKLVVMMACLSYLARINRHPSTHKLALGLWRPYDVLMTMKSIGQEGYFSSDLHDAWFGWRASHRLVEVYRLRGMLHSFEALQWRNTMECSGRTDPLASYSILLHSTNVHFKFHRLF